MKTWKLVSGILSIIAFAVIEFQSCAVGVVNAIDKSDDISGACGFVCGILILTGGIVSIATRNSEKNGGNITLLILFGLAALFGFAGQGIYKDLVIWAMWALINAILAAIAMRKKKKEVAE